MDINAEIKRGFQLHSRNQLKEAANIYKSVLQVAPNNVSALNLLSDIALRSGQPDAASQMLEHALTLDPNNGELWIRLGNARVALKHPEQAIPCFEQALHQPLNAANRAATLANMGLCYKDTATPETGIARIREALELSPETAAFHDALATLLLSAGDLVQAEQAVSRAVDLAPHSLSLLTNRARIRADADNFEGALADYDRVLAEQPEHAHARYHHALVRLKQGDIKDAWPDLAFRYDALQRKRNDRKWYRDIPEWRGEPLDGKRLFVWPDQGVGDEVLHSHFIPALQQLGASHIRLLCSPRLVPLFSRSFPDVDCVAFDDQAIPEQADWDFHICICDLGRQLWAGWESVRLQTPLLSPEPTARDRLRAQYSEQSDGRPLIGISWHSKAKGGKNIPLDQWDPILKTPGIRFVCLQYGPAEEDLNYFNARTEHPVLNNPSIDPLSDLDLAAAEIAAMDCVVSISNTAVHLSGSMGIPTHVMLPKGPDLLWYWLLKRSDSPWYPNITLHRQVTREDWAKPVHSVATALANRDF